MELNSALTSKQVLVRISARNRWPTHTEQMRGHFQGYGVVKHPGVTAGRVTTPSSAEGLREVCSYRNPEQVAKATDIERACMPGLGTFFRRKQLTCIPEGMELGVLTAPFPAPSSSLLPVRPSAEHIRKLRAWWRVYTATPEASPLGHRVR